MSMQKIYGLAYFNRVVKMKPFQLNKVHNGFLKKQIDIITQEAEDFMVYTYSTLPYFSISLVL